MALMCTEIYIVQVPCGVDIRVVLTLITASTLYCMVPHYWSSFPPAIQQYYITLHQKWATYASSSSSTGCPSWARNMSCVLFRDRNTRVCTLCFTTGSWTYTEIRKNQVPTCKNLPITLISLRVRVPPWSQTATSDVVRSKKNKISTPYRKYRLL